MTIEEKIPHMKQWWTESHQIIVKNKLKKDFIKSLVKGRLDLRY